MTGKLALVISALLIAPCLTTNTRASQTSPDSRVKTDQAIFDFHSSFWINLHHFLLPVARRRDQLKSNPPSASTPTTAQGSTLTLEQQRAWDATLDYYTESGLIKRDLLFDEKMVTIKARLVEMESAADLRKANLEPELIAALERAAVVYRAVWWPQHDKANRDWIAAVSPKVKQFGSAWPKEFASAYHAKWPAGKIRVDVSRFAGQFGAYTIDNPLHIMISSTDENLQGYAALETLFHEASHSMVDVTNCAVADAIARECRAHNKPIPDRFWHALLFYTTGEIVKRGLAARGVKDYAPYAYQTGVYNRGMQNYQRVLEKYWQPYLEGKSDFDKAIADMIVAL
ncbi:MAG TPA: hypothetical protein VLR90_20195 [Blastocatellia bacterium]|nr:hypothetical protein [Blastocatellia bacterium]